MRSRLTAETILDLREHRDVTYKAGGEGATNLKSPAKGAEEDRGWLPEAVDDSCMEKLSHKNIILQIVSDLQVRRPKQQQEERADPCLQVGCLLDARRVK